ncbi:MAG: YkgJ family cysteine cluster protein [Deltaproteobacteria bacterium]|nr:YkgJ family cysteine cluster protein [Deltaproteobacteria bacterium]
MESTNGEFAEPLPKIQKELSSGLLYTHTRINANTTKILEAASFLYALIELLDEKGLISIDELDERKKHVAGRLVQNFVESGIGLMYQDIESDKYIFEHEAKVDCQSRLPFCKAICCKFPFALSRQDVEEGIVKWEFARPYLINHDPEGYCSHLDRETYRCTVHENRPLPCRGFDCQDNEKWQVWVDYEKRVVNHELMEQINESNEKIYSISELRSKSDGSTL